MPTPVVTAPSETPPVVTPPNEPPMYKTIIEKVFQKYESTQTNPIQYQYEWRDAVIKYTYYKLITEGEGQTLIMLDRINKCINKYGGWGDFHVYPYSHRTNLIRAPTFEYEGVGLFKLSTDSETIQLRYSRPLLRYFDGTHGDSFVVVGTITPSIIGLFGDLSTYAYEFFHNRNNNCHRISKLLGYDANSILKSAEFCDAVNRYTFASFSGTKYVDNNTTASAVLTDILQRDSNARKEILCEIFRTLPMQVVPCSVKMDGSMDIPGNHPVSRINMTTPDKNAKDMVKSSKHSTGAFTFDTENACITYKQTREMRQGDEHTVKNYGKHFIVPKNVEARQQHEFDRIDQILQNNDEEDMAMALLTCIWIETNPCLSSFCDHQTKHVLYTKLFSYCDPKDTRFNKRYLTARIRSLVCRLMDADPWAGLSAHRILQRMQECMGEIKEGSLITYFDNHEWWDLVVQGVTQSNNVRGRILRSDLTTAQTIYFGQWRTIQLTNNVTCDILRQDELPQSAPIGTYFVSKVGVIWDTADKAVPAWKDMSGGTWDMLDQNIKTVRTCLRNQTTPGGMDENEQRRYWSNLILNAKGDVGHLLSIDCTPHSNNFNVHFNVHAHRTDEGDKKDSNTVASPSKPIECNVSRTNMPDDLIQNAMVLQSMSSRLEKKRKARKGKLYKTTENKRKTHSCTLCPNDPPYTSASGLWYHMTRTHRQPFRRYRKTKKRFQQPIRGEKQVYSYIRSPDLNSVRMWRDTIQKLKYCLDTYVGRCGLLPDTNDKLQFLPARLRKWTYAQVKHYRNANNTKKYLKNIMKYDSIKKEWEELINDPNYYPFFNMGVNTSNNATPRKIRRIKRKKKNTGAKTFLTSPSGLNKRVKRASQPGLLQPGRKCCDTCKMYYCICHSIGGCSDVDDASGSGSTVSSCDDVENNDQTMEMEEDGELIIEIGKSCTRFKKNGNGEIIDVAKAQSRNNIRLIGNWGYCNMNTCEGDQQERTPPLKRRKVVAPHRGAPKRKHIDEDDHDVIDSISIFASKTAHGLEIVEGFTIFASARPRKRTIRHALFSTGNTRFGTRSISVAKVPTKVPTGNRKLTMRRGKGPWMMEYNRSWGPFASGTFVPIIIVERSNSGIHGTQFPYKVSAPHIDSNNPDNVWYATADDLVRRDMRMSVAVPVSKPWFKLNRKNGIPVKFTIIEIEYNIKSKRTVFVLDSYWVKNKGVATKVIHMSSTREHVTYFFQNKEMAGKNYTFKRNGTAKDFKECGVSFDMRPTNVFKKNQGAYAIMTYKNNRFDPVANKCVWKLQYGKQSTRTEPVALLMWKDHGDVYGGFYGNIHITTGPTQQIRDIRAHFHTVKKREWHPFYEKGNDGGDFYNIYEVRGIGWYYDTVEYINTRYSTFEFVGLIRERPDGSGTFEYQITVDKCPLDRGIPYTDAYVHVVPRRYGNSQSYIHCGNCSRSRSIHECTSNRVTCKHCSQRLLMPLSSFINRNKKIK